MLPLKMSSWDQSSFHGLGSGSCILLDLNNDGHVVITNNNLTIIIFL